MVTTRSVRRSASSPSRSSAKVASATAMPVVISRAARSTALASGSSAPAPPFGLGDDGAYIVVGDAKIAADLDVVRELVRRAREIADLQDRHLAQPRVEPALMADELAERGKAA